MSGINIYFYDKKICIGDELHIAGIVWKGGYKILFIKFVAVRGDCKIVKE
jgi:hypothetical protein